CERVVWGEDVAADLLGRLDQGDVELFGAGDFVVVSVEDAVHGGLGLAGHGSVRLLVLVDALPADAGRTEAAGQRLDGLGRDEVEPLRGEGGELLHGVPSVGTGYAGYSVVGVGAGRLGGAGRPRWAVLTLLVADERVAAEELGQDDQDQEPG